MRIFIDPNIVISAILFPDGKVAKVFSHLLENHTVIISSYTDVKIDKPLIFTPSKYFELIAEKYGYI
ncbi:hypothetical protein [Treponema denticola]|uniref:hypothetical protein n=1 Tax=Treponema denticola TaxID=158 RepID=UPI0005D1828C